MLTRRQFGGVLLGAAWSAGAGSAGATAVYRYKKGEFPIVSDGRSPDGQYSIASHGEGEFGDENFHLYLFAEPEHKRIGPLEEVDRILDTAPDAYSAIWSADSRHVALLYRSDRHIRALTLYRIERRRAFIVTGPTVLEAKLAMTVDGRPDLELRARGLDFAWGGESRFQLSENGTVQTRLPDVLRKLGADPAEADRPDGPEAGPHVEYNGVMICRIAGDRYEVVEFL